MLVCIVMSCFSTKTLFYINEKIESGNLVSRIKGQISLHNYFYYFFHLSPGLLVFLFTNHQFFCRQWLEQSNRSVEKCLSFMCKFDLLSEFLLHSNLQLIILTLARRKLCVKVGVAFCSNNCRDKCDGVWSQKVFVFHLHNQLSLVIANPLLESLSKNCYSQVKALIRWDSPPPVPDMFLC